MARIARVVIPHVPHHVTQRGNRRQAVFFSNTDFQTYIDLLSDACREAGTESWAYCLMPNHVHLVLIPGSTSGLHAVFGEAHRRYTRMINRRYDWRGHLWQERFHSTPMDEIHLLAAVRYVELNPVRAGLVVHPEDWRWSSATAHLEGRDDRLVRVAPMLSRVDDWRHYLSVSPAETDLDAIRKSTRTGRPLGSPSFIDQAGKLIGRSLGRQRPGPRARDEKGDK